MEGLEDRPTILVVDDDANVLGGMQSFLELNYNVLTAGNGEEGFEVFKENPDIGVVVTDFDMPKMNGGELLNEIKSARPETPVIIMSGMNCGKIQEAYAVINKTPQEVGYNVEEALREYPKEPTS